MSSPLTNDSGSDIFSYDNLQKYDTLLYKLGKTLTTKGKTLHPSLAEMKQIVLIGLVWFGLVEFWWLKVSKMNSAYPKNSI